MTIEIKQLTIRSTVESGFRGRSDGEAGKTCQASGLKEEILKEVDRLIKQKLRDTADR